MQIFTLKDVEADTVGQDIGYWAKRVNSQRATYIVNIVRDGEDLYTVGSCRLSERKVDMSPNVVVAGVGCSLPEAVELANEAGDNLHNYDLFVRMRTSNSVGSKVLINR